MIRPRTLLVICALLISVSVTGPLVADDYFGIQVLDRATGRGVPLVELKTVNGIEYITDSAGWVAFYEPGLMNQNVFFHVKSHGYEFPADGFGIRGRKLHTTPGATATLQLDRKNIAERLYRITGEGIYRDSILLNRPTPIEHPVLNAGVLGSDSVLCTPFQGKLYWFWGDTNLASYPLGLFHTPGATSPLPGPETIPASQGINLTYFTNENQLARNTAVMPGEGPTWLSGLTVLKDSAGKEHLLAGYAKIKNLLTVYERGIVEFNPTTSSFEKRLTLPRDTPLYPDGHPCYVRENNVDYVYFARPFPDMRVKATLEDFLNVSRYEAYTCLTRDPDTKKLMINRSEDGHVQYAWRREAPARDWHEEVAMLKAGQLKEDDLHFQLRNKDGQHMIAHSGSVAWNEYRKRYVLITMQAMGTSGFGEIWYAEAPELLGPWSPARKIVTHENYTFYNPLQHPEFSEDGGRFIYFEATYTHTFSSNPVPTPRYDYNQIMYRLDLSDRRLELLEE